MELSNTLSVIKPGLPFIDLHQNRQDTESSETEQLSPSHDFYDDQQFPSSGLGTDDYLNERFSMNFCNEFGEVLSTEPFDISTELQEVIETINYNSFPHNSPSNPYNAGITPNQKSKETHSCPNRFISIDFIPLLHGINAQLGLIHHSNPPIEIIGGAVPYLLTKKFYISYVQKRDRKSLEKAEHYCRLYSTIIENQPNDYDCRLWIKRNNFINILDNKSFQTNFAQKLAATIELNRGVLISPIEIEKHYFEKIQLIRNKSLFLAMAGFGSFNGSPIEIVIRLIDEDDNPTEGRPFLFTKDQSALALKIINDQVSVSLKFYHMNHNESHVHDETTLFHQINLILDTPNFNGMNWRGWICAMGLSTKWWRSLKSDLYPNLWRCLEQEKCKERTFARKELIDEEIAWFETNHLANPRQFRSLFKSQQIALRWNIWTYLIDQKKLDSDDFYHLPMQIQHLLEKSDESVSSPYAKNIMTTLLNLIFSKEIANMSIETRLAWFRLAMWVQSSMIGQPIGSISTNNGQKSYRISLTLDEPAVIWISVAIDASIGLILESIKNIGHRNRTKPILQHIFSFIMMKSPENLYRFHHREYDELIRLSNELKLMDDPDFLLVALRIDQTLVANQKLPSLPAIWINLLPQFLAHHSEEIDSFLDLFSNNQLPSSDIKFIAQPTLETIQSPIDWTLYLLDTNRPEMIKEGYRILENLEYDNLKSDKSGPDDLLKALKLDLALIKRKKKSALPIKWIELMPRLLKKYPTELTKIYQNLARITEDDSIDPSKKMADPSLFKSFDLDTDLYDNEPNLNTVLTPIEWALYLIQSQLKGGTKLGEKILEIMDPQVIRNHVTKIQDPEELLNFYKHLQNRSDIHQLIDSDQIYTAIYYFLSKRLPQPILESINSQKDQIDLIPLIFFAIAIKGTFLGCKIEPKIDDRSKKSVYITIEMNTNLPETAFQSQKSIQVPIPIDNFISEAIKSFKSLNPIVSHWVITSGSTLASDKFSVTKSFQQIKESQEQRSQHYFINALMPQEKLIPFFKLLKEADPQSTSYQLVIHLGLLINSITKKNYISIVEWLIEYPKIHKYHQLYKQEVRNFIATSTAINNKPSPLILFMDQSEPIDPLRWMIELLTNEQEVCQQAGMTLLKKEPVENRAIVEKELLLYLKEKINSSIKSRDQKVQQNCKEYIQRVCTQSIHLNLPKKIAKELPVNYLQRVLNELNSSISAHSTDLPRTSNIESIREVDPKTKESEKTNTKKPVPKTFENKMLEEPKAANKKESTNPQTPHENPKEGSHEVKTLNLLIAKTLTRRDKKGLYPTIDSIMVIVKSARSIPEATLINILDILIKFKITDLSYWHHLANRRAYNNLFTNKLKELFSSKNEFGILLFGTKNITFLAHLLFKLNTLFASHKVTQILTKLIPENSSCELYAVRVVILQKLAMKEQASLNIIFHEFFSNLNKSKYAKMEYFKLRETLIFDLLLACQNSGYGIVDSAFINKSLLEKFRLSVRIIYDQYGSKICYDLLYLMGYYIEKEIPSPSIFPFYIAACRELCTKDNLFFSFIDHLQRILSSKFDNFSTINILESESNNLNQMAISFDGLSELFDIFDDIWNQGDIEKIKSIRAIYINLAIHLKVVNQNLKHETLVLQETKFQALLNGLLMTNHKSWLRHLLMHLKEMSMKTDILHRAEVMTEILVLHDTILNIFYKRITKSDAHWFYTEFFICDKEVNEIFDKSNFITSTPEHTLSKVNFTRKTVPYRDTFLIELSNLRITELGAIAYVKFTLHQFFNLFDTPKTKFKNIIKYRSRFNLFTKFLSELPISSAQKKHQKLISNFYNLTKSCGIENEWLVEEMNPIAIIDNYMKMPFAVEEKMEMRLEELNNHITNQIKNHSVKHSSRSFEDELKNLEEFYTKMIGLYVYWEVKNQTLWYDLINQITYSGNALKALLAFYKEEHMFGLEILGEDCRELLVSLFRQLYLNDPSPFNDVFDHLISTLIPENCTNPIILQNKLVIEYLRTSPSFATTKEELRQQLLSIEISMTSVNTLNDHKNSTNSNEVDQLANLESAIKHQTSLINHIDPFTLAKKFISAFSPPPKQDLPIKEEESSQDEIRLAGHLEKLIISSILQTYGSDPLELAIKSLFLYSESPDHLISSFKSLVEITLTLSQKFLSEEQIDKRKELSSTLFTTVKLLLERIQTLILNCNCPDPNVYQEFNAYLTSAQGEQLKLLFSLVHTIYNPLDNTDPQKLALFDFYQCLVPIFSQIKPTSRYQHKLLPLLRATSIDTWCSYIQHIHSNRKNNIKNIKADMKNILEIEQGLLFAFPNIRMYTLNHFYADFFAFDYWKSPYFREKFHTFIAESPEIKEEFITTLWDTNLPHAALENYVQAAIQYFKKIFSIHTTIIDENKQSIYKNRFQNFNLFIKRPENLWLYNKFQDQFFNLTFFASDRGWNIGFNIFLTNRHK
jgi:hypothetical protein